jgi:hypothetical protein
VTSVRACTVLPRPQAGKVQHARRTAAVHQAQEGEQPGLRRRPGTQRKLPLLRKSVDLQHVGLVVEVAVALRQPQRQQEPTLQSGTSPRLLSVDVSLTAQQD